MKADTIPSKSLYFVSGSKRLEPGEKYSGLYGKSFAFKRSSFSLFRQCLPKIVKNYLFLGAPSPHIVKSSKNIFL